LFIIITPACKKKETKAPVEKLVNVRVQAVEEKPLKPFVETIGTLNPYEEVIVSAEVDGILKEVKVDNGTAISRGMLLTVIDDTDYGLEVKRAEAALRLQFIIEALTLSLIGGTAGIVIGISGSKILSMLAGWETIVSPLSVFLAFGFSGLVGLFFGFYPAYKASLLNPIDALRYE